MDDAGGGVDTEDEGVDDAELVHAVGLGEVEAKWWLKTRKNK